MGVEWHRRKVAQEGCLGILGKDDLIWGGRGLRCKYPHHWLRAAGGELYLVPHTSVLL